jgi:hypothetical protein
MLVRFIAPEIIDQIGFGSAAKCVDSNLADCLLVFRFFVEEFHYLAAEIA